MATIINFVGIYVPSGQIREYHIFGVTTALKVFPFGGNWLSAWWDVRSQK
jgi:hypothetical protein